MIPMFTFLNTIVIVMVGIICQYVLIPAHIADPFKPNLLIILVVYIGFRSDFRVGALSSFFLGLLHDSLSGTNFGLSGFTFLFIFFLYHEIAGRLYTWSRLLMMFGAFLASVIHAMLSLILLLLFSSSAGVYASILQSLLLQGLINAVLSACLFNVIPVTGREKAL